jgi:hypothetical protein
MLYKMNVYTHDACLIEKEAAEVMLGISALCPDF